MHPLSRRQFLARTATAALYPLAGSVHPAQSIGLPSENTDTRVVVRPPIYFYALKNPLMGFRPDLGAGAFAHEFATLARHYIRWNEIENTRSDGIDRIRAFCSDWWKGVPEANIKIIPRVYLHWSADTERYWPSDLRPGDYSSSEFKDRLIRLIGRLGECWDSDSRVAFVQMGIIGKWGEHHSPEVSAEMQRLLGDAFTQAFTRKPVMVRHPWDFKDYRFGIYWDSFAHADQMANHGAAIEAISPRWKIAPIGGEVAYNWGNVAIQPGKNPDDSLSDLGHRTHLINTIRRLHANHLGWIANYSPNLPPVHAGAEAVQHAFGYRFVLNEVKFPARIDRSRPFQVDFSVRNLGSTPIYQNWPVEVSLLNTASKQAVWSSVFPNLDIRQWLPGDNWDAVHGTYQVVPETTKATGEFRLPDTLPKGVYYLALAILDPAGQLPCVRFSCSNYFKGGRHPIGRIGVDTNPGQVTVDEIPFDDPKTDRTLHYN